MTRNLLVEVQRGQLLVQPASEGRPVTYDQGRAPAWPQIESRWSALTRSATARSATPAPGPLRAALIDLAASALVLAAGRTPPTCRRTLTAASASAGTVFTEDFGSFKPPEHNMLGVEIAETVFEPRVGGHLYDRGIDGSECRWARVLAYEPPNRVVISWDISPQWQLETDLEKTSDAEVRFISETPERIRVELEHRNLHRHGEGWDGGTRRRRRRESLAAVPAAVRRATRELSAAPRGRPRRWAQALAWKPRRVA
jgi:hypothetical protein